MYIHIEREGDIMYIYIYIYLLIIIIIIVIKGPPHHGLAAAPHHDAADGAAGREHVQGRPPTKKKML